MSRATVAGIEAEFTRYKALGEGAMDQMKPDELVAPLPSGNSVATIAWHIAGNLESRFTDFLTTDGEKPWRNRESEFEARGASPEEVREKWERGWAVLLASLAELEDTDLPTRVSIRGVPLRADEALARALGHISYHVGQIVLVAKGFRGSDWRYLSIPPGGSRAYNAQPSLEKPTEHAREASE